MPNVLYLGVFLRDFDYVRSDRPGIVCIDVLFVKILGLGSKPLIVTGHVCKSISVLSRKNGRNPRNMIRMG